MGHPTRCYDHDVERVLVGGISGVGKTTFARQIAAACDLPYHEMDALFHGPHWQPIPTFEQDVAAIVSQSTWVFDSHGYRTVRDLVWSRADTVVWLDFSRAVVMRRVLVRSASRALRRDPIFNGNVERFRDWLSPEHPVRWAWTQFENRRRDMTERFESEQYRQVTKLRFSTPSAALSWLQDVPR